MARLSTVRSRIVMLLLATACRPNAPGRSEQPPRLGSQGSGSAVVAPVEAPPPGTDELVAPPADVAAKVTLKEVAHGLARPVLFTFAPNDARHRLFIIEQNGDIKILDNGAVATKPFLALDPRELSH